MITTNGTTIKEHKKRNVHRSPAYPSINLEKAIPLAQKLSEKFSDDVFSRDNAVTELGLKKGGTAFRKIAALVHFGLTNRKGSSYNITPLAKQIIFPGDNENIRQSAIIIAAKNPKLYKNLILSNQGKQLPTALHHGLITREGFNQSVAEEVAKDFKESMEFAGILKNGIIVISSEDNIIPQSTEVEESDSPLEEGVKPQIGATPVKKTTAEGVTFQLGKNITVILSENLVKDITMGKFGNRFAKALESLEKLEEGGEDGTGNNASNTSVESA